MKYLVVLSVLSIPFLVNYAFADCILDNNWPEKPCLDMPLYPKSELVEIWDEYYSIKGQEWMDMKKSEMDYAIEHGILQKWLAFGVPQSGNFQNHNVYFYYFLNDQAPDIKGVHFAEQLLQKEDRNPDVEKYPSDLPDNNLSNVIITYYYVSIGGFLVLIPLIAGVGMAGFFGGKKILHTKNNKNSVR